MDANIPVGERLLLRDNSWTSTMFEAIIREYSPSGRYVLLAYPNGNTDWREAAPIMIVEYLQAKAEVTDG